MVLSTRSMVFNVILFIGYCFCLGRAIDCGGNLVAKTITVDQKGRGMFKRIQQAVDSIKHNNDRWIKIQIMPGKYREEISIPYDKPCIILKGSDRRTTTIYGDDIQSKAIFTSSPPNVVLSGITIENTHGSNGKAVAATIFGNNSAIFDCSFLGYQDTLWDALGRHYYKNCYIQGEVDFIFGQAQSYFEDCVINATQGHAQPAGFITAQRRYSSTESTGFIFKGGHVEGIGKVHLGRAWGPYSRVLFWGTHLSAVVLPQGWNAWNYQGRENNFMYAEIDCTGPGANTRERVKWTKKQHKEINLQEYSLSSFINKDGWLAHIPKL